MRVNLRRISSIHPANPALTLAELSAKVAGYHRTGSTARNGQRYAVHPAQQKRNGKSQAYVPFGHENLGKS